MVKYVSFQAFVCRHLIYFSPRFKNLYQEQFRQHNLVAHIMVKSKTYKKLVSWESHLELLLTSFFVSYIVDT